MASALYPSFKEGLLNKEFNLDTDTIKAAFVTDAYNPADTVLGDVIVLGTSPTINATTITGGVFDGDDIASSALAAGSTVVGVVLYDDTHALDKLIAFIDITDTLTNDGIITVTWDAGANKIFAL